MFSALLILTLALFSSTTMTLGDILGQHAERKSDRRERLQRRHENSDRGNDNGEVGCDGAHAAEITLPQGEECVDVGGEPENAAPRDAALDMAKAEE